MGKYLKILSLFTSIGLVLLSLRLEAQVLPDERLVSAEFVKIPIDSALLTLSLKSGIGISFDPSIIPSDNRVTLSANKLHLGLALDNVLVNTKLHYKIVGNQLVIKRIDEVTSSDVATLSGFLLDSKTGEGMVYANIFSTDGKYGGTSNEYGYYSVTLPLGIYELQFSYVGYEPKVILMNLEKDTISNIYLEPQAFLNEVVIRGEVPKVSKQTEDFDQLPIEMLGGMPSLLGESDVIRMAQMRSGIGTQVDGFGGLQVRGGSTDQNLILLDGVPVYNTGHALGLYSIFNSSIVKSAKLIKGGFPARYGGRLSSVLDVRVREGNNQKISGDAALSPLMVKATLEGPIQKGKSSFLVSARRTIIDPILKPLSRYQFERSDEEGQINFLFYDLNAKINFQLGRENQIYLSAYAGKDRYANQVLGTITDINGNEIEELDQTDINWGNQIATLRWTSTFNKKMFGHASVSYTQFDFDNFEFDRTYLNRGSNPSSPGFTSRLFSSRIKDFIAAYDVDWYVSPAYYLKIGISYTNHEMIPGSDFSANEDDLLDENDLITLDQIKDVRSFDPFTGSEIRSYLENEVRLGRCFSANIGAHFSSIEVSGTIYRTIQPRISAKFIPISNMTIKAGYSEMDQYFHLLSSAGLGLPSDVWLPSTDIIAPERSKVLSAGVEFTLSKDLSVGVSAYSKNLDRIIGSAEGAVFDIRGNVDWQNSVPIGKGKTRGVEVEIEKRLGKIQGWASYTFAESNRTFENINQGLPFRAPNDRRHTVNLNTLTKLNENMEFSLAWTFGSSLPTTLPASTDPIVVNGKIIYVPTYLNINNALLPPYHKLDVGINLYNKYDWGNQKFSIGAYNVYSRKNPFYIDVVFDESGGVFLFEQVSILPFVPYISLGVSF